MKQRYSSNSFLLLWILEEEDLSSSESGALGHYSCIFYSQVFWYYQGVSAL